MAPHPTEWGWGWAMSTGASAGQPGREQCGLGGRAGDQTEQGRRAMRGPWWAGTLSQAPVRGAQSLGPASPLPKGLPPPGLLPQSEGL